MKITGEMLIGKRALSGTESTLRATNPVLGAELDPPFGGGGVGEVEEACSLAQEALLTYRETSFELRARFLEMIGSGILELGETLIVRAQAETGLPKARLETERARTAGQLKLFATVVRSGCWLSDTVDLPLPERTPPRPDLRLRKYELLPKSLQESNPLSLWRLRDGERLQR